MGPVNNPSETYGYFSLPFCGKDGSSVDQDLGESLTGDRKVETPYELNFRKDVEFKEVCVKVRGSGPLPPPPVFCNFSSGASAPPPSPHLLNSFPPTPPIQNNSPTPRAGLFA